MTSDEAGAATAPSEEVRPRSQDLGSAPRVAPPFPRGLRRVARVSVPITFVAVFLTALTLAIPVFRLDRPAFSHHYASVPVVPSKLATGNPMSPVPSTNVLTGFTISTPALFEQALPPTAIAGTGKALTLLQPVVVSSGARLNLSGPGSLTMSPGSYIEVAPGGVVRISNMKILGGTSSVNRGFILAVGGLLILRGDHVIGLGRRATLTEGISFYHAARGSGVFDCRIEDNFTGVFATATNGLVLVGNRIVNAAMDGIVLRAAVDNATVIDNVVVASGLDGIVLSGDVLGTRIVRNRLESVVRYGLLLYDVVGSNTIEGNRVTGSFDGIVLNATSHSTIADNIVSRAARFGLRLSGPSANNLIANCVFTSNDVGVYMATGAHANRVLNDHFSGNAENVRLRRSAAGNVVLPVPLRSELRSA